MRIETKTYEVYQFHELTKEAQVKAHRHWVEHFDYTWSEENRNTLQLYVVKQKCTSANIVLRFDF